MMPAGPEYVCEGVRTERAADHRERDPPIAALPTARITRPRRFARGTVVDMFDPTHWAADDDDALTRGRRSMRRSSSRFLAA